MGRLLHEADPVRASALAGRVPDAYACEDLGWDSKRFQNGLKTLSEAGFVKYDGMAKVVWIVKFVKWNRPDNPNQQKSIIKLAQALPDSLAFKDEILASIGVSETVAKPLGNSPVPAPVPVSVSTPEGMQGEVLRPLRRDAGRACRHRP
jgi:hypothetical protein